VILNNHSLGQIKWEQMVLDANPEFGVDLQPIEFAKYAEAVGAAGFRRLWLEERSIAAKLLNRSLKIRPAR
jgi:thiamine pyrophosphate-dependent acetolactate synthase large subunit-like protein